mgnify:CR=1 FL=1
MTPNSELPPKYDRNTLSPEELALVDSLPFDELIFRKLFDFIDGLMSSYSCDEPLAYTGSFLAKQGIALSEHMAFFNKHHVKLDYEIVTVLEPKFPVDQNEFERRKI